MPRNTLEDLNNHLFETLERLNDDELDFEKELKRAKAINETANRIIENANTLIHAEKVYSESVSLNTVRPELVTPK